MPRQAMLAKAAGAGCSLCAPTAPSTSMTSSLGLAGVVLGLDHRWMKSAVLKAISDIKESTW